MRKFVTGVLISWFVMMSIAGAKGNYPEEIPCFPTPRELVDKMLELADVKKGDVLYDLGSGDRRVVIRTAKKYDIRAVGIEIDRVPLANARKDAKTAGGSHLVQRLRLDACHELLHLKCESTPPPFSPWRRSSVTAS